MPRYDYVCQDCGERFTVRRSISEYTERPTQPCASCGSERTIRMFSGFNVVTSRTGGGESGGVCGPGCAPGCCQ